MPASLRDIEIWAEKLCERLLRPYIESLRKPAQRPYSREFNDPVWNTISATAFEVVIIDSPLFQRLRRIRQLGVVHWVYPGALHSRFEHSLGVLHQVEQLAESINRSARQDGEDALTIGDKALLRFGALCHDLGHGTMSHVVEHALSSFDEVDNLLVEFSDAHVIEKPSFTELIAYYLIGTPSFKELVAAAANIAEKDAPPKDAIDQVRSMIVGKMVKPEMPLLHNLISGPFDADKLDWMRRDAVMCGVPAVTDVPRLIRKVRAKWVPEDKLPEKIAKGVRSGLGQYLLFGIAFSGSRTLDELLIARVLLFDKVYRHQKVRALEGMVAKLYEAMARAYKGNLFELPYLFVDDTLSDGDEILPERKDFDFSSFPTELGVIRELCARLRERRLYVRAFVFSVHFKEFENDQNSAEGMRLFKTYAGGSRKEELLREISAEVLKVLKILDKEYVLDELSDKSLGSYLWMDPPTETDHTKKIAHAYLFRENGEILAYSDHSVEVPRWSPGYLSKKDVGFIFSIPELKTEVFLAIERLLAGPDFRVTIPRSAYSYLKTQFSELSSAHETLRKSGYYAGIPYERRPIPERLTRADFNRSLERILRNLQGYDGPSGQDKSFSKETIIRWAIQFETELQIEVAIEIAKRIKFFGRGDSIATLKKFFGENPNFSDAEICAFGDPKDSGAMVAYAAGDLHRSPIQLETALTRKKPIVFVDDFIGSGGQSKSILANWFGLTGDIDLGEERRKTLDADQRKHLAEVPIAFVFSGGWSDGKKALLNRCQEYGLSASCYIHDADTSLPNVNDGDLKALPGFTDFIEISKNVTREIFRKKHPKWDEEKIEQRLLGYGNRGQLVTFGYNTPSQALTILWESGTYQDVEWAPLLRRREKT